MTHVQLELADIESMRPHNLFDVGRHQLIKLNVDNNSKEGDLIWVSRVFVIINDNCGCLMGNAFALLTDLKYTNRITDGGIT